MTLAADLAVEVLPAEDLTSAQVTITGYFYRVEFGAALRTRVHLVGKDRRCTCSKGAVCPAVAAVAAYLKAGGERAPHPPAGFYPVAPHTCPICGQGAIYDPGLSSKRRGAGWRCEQAGSRHYWEAQVQVLKQKIAANPWLFPPVVVRNLSQIPAFDGTQEGDTVLYPGILRVEIASTTQDS